MLVYCAFCLELFSTYFALEGKGAPIVLWITQSIFSFKRKGQVLSCIKRGGGHLIVFLKSTNTLKSYILVKPVRSKYSLSFILFKLNAQPPSSLLSYCSYKVKSYRIQQLKASSLDLKVKTCGVSSLKKSIRKPLFCQLNLGCDAVCPQQFGHTPHCSVNFMIVLELCPPSKGIGPYNLWIVVICDFPNYSCAYRNQKLCETL